MELADYIEANKDRLIDRWKQYAVERLSLKLDASALLDDLPEFLDELVELMRAPAGDHCSIESARQHGQHRMRIGIDISGLTEEMILMGEVVMELAHQDGQQPSAEDVLLLMRMIGRGAAASVSAYAAMRDKQLADQAAQHFSFIAHEIRNPLNNARLAAELISAGRGEEGETPLQTLERALAELADLVDNSLLSARLFGEPQLHVQRHQALDLIDAACNRVAPQARRKAIEVDVEAEPFDLDADRKLIVSALTNLLQNAVKFSCDAGRVVARARRLEDRVLFEVEDQCGGLAEEEMPQLFEPFVQLGADGSGFGLGLGIVKQAAESHGGTVRVVNQPGTGCCFVVELPRLRQTP